MAAYNKHASIEALKGCGRVGKTKQLFSSQNSQSDTCEQGVPVIGKLPNYSKHRSIETLVEKKLVTKTRTVSAHDPSAFGPSASSKPSQEAVPAPVSQKDPALRQLQERSTEHSIVHELAEQIEWKTPRLGDHSIGTAVDELGSLAPRSRRTSSFASSFATSRQSSASCQTQEDYGQNTSLIGANTLPADEVCVVVASSCLPSEGVMESAVDNLGSDTLVTSAEDAQNTLVEPGCIKEVHLPVEDMSVDNQLGRASPVQDTAIELAKKGGADPVNYEQHWLRKFLCCCGSICSL